MQRPWLAAIVILFWCLTTSWLVVEKILPALRTGSPPGYQALYASNNRLIPVAWTVHWNGQPLGWATSQSQTVDGGSICVESLLHLDRLPLDKILPVWIKPMLHRVSDPITFEARGSLLIDATGHLKSFHSTVDLPGTKDKVFLNGTVADDQVHVVLRARDIRYEASRYLPSSLTIGDELSPQATLPGLSEGRRWTVPVYNPLRASQSPIEVLHAEVIGDQTLFWEDHLIRVQVVVYRDDPSSHHEPRSQLWVAHDGRVLRQETAILGSRITFIRRSDAAAKTLAAGLTEYVPDMNEEP